MHDSVVLARGLTGASTYSSFQYDLVLYALIAVGLGLFGSMIYALVTRGEISKKYRTASHASALICGIAALAYLVLIGFWLAGFRLQGDSWIPNPSHYFSNGFRYADWTITVPLLVVELLSVCAVAGARARTLRATAMPAAFLMILTGFIGNELNEGATPNTAALLIWGAVSTVFYVYLYVVLAAAVRQTLPEVSAPTATSLRNALILLLGLWGVYPLAYLVLAFVNTSAYWAVTVQLAFCAADLAAKAGFGALIHKIAKLRTAEDANAGAETFPDIYPQEVYLSHEQMSVPAHAFGGQDGLAIFGDRSATAGAGAGTVRLTGSESGSVRR